MKTSPCNLRAVALLSEGLLPAAEAARVIRHMEGCEACRERHRQYRELAADFRFRARAASPAPLPERVHARVSAALRPDAGTEGPGWSRLLAGAAAGIVVLVLVFLLARPAEPGPGLGPRPGKAREVAVGDAAPSIPARPAPADFGDPSVGAFRRAWDRSEFEFDRALAAGGRSTGMGGAPTLALGAARIEALASVE